MSLIAVKTAVLACATAGLEFFVLFVVMAGTFLVGDVVYSSIQGASHGMRAAVAVATSSLWCVTSGAAVCVSLRVVARKLHASTMGAVFVVAVLNGLVLYPFLAYATYVNDCSWSVAFPLGERFECGR